MATVLTDDTAKRHIAANVQRCLAARGWSQSELARRTGESPVVINYIVHGEKLAKAGLLARIAEALEVSTDELLAKPARAKKTA